MTDPYWCVSFFMAPDRPDEPPAPDLWVQAPTSKAAIILAIAAFEVREGELFHTVHIGRPVHDLAEAERLKAISLEDDPEDNAPYAT